MRHVLYGATGVGVVLIIMFGIFPAPAPPPANPGRAAISGRLVTDVGWVTNTDIPDNAEVWWVTMRCPPGVPAPCLDGSVSLRDLPRWAGGDTPGL